MVAFLIWNLSPQIARFSRAKAFDVQKITGQDRIDSIKIYRDIKALQDELDVLMEQKEKKENENAGTSKESEADDMDGNNLRKRSKLKKAKTSNFQKSINLCSRRRRRRRYSIDC